MTKEELKKLYDTLKRRTETPIVFYRAFGHDLICQCYSGIIEASKTVWYYPKEISELKDYEEIEVKIELNITEIDCSTKLFFMFHGNGGELERCTCTKEIIGDDLSPEILERHLNQFVYAVKALR